MPNLSEKGIYLPPSPIRKLVPYAEEAKRRGIKVHHLNIGQPDIPTPAVAVEAVRAVHDRVFEYSHSAGIESYRRKLAGYYTGIGIDITYEDLLVTVGGSEAIFMAMTVCMNPGDEVLVPEPFYANYNGFAMEAGVNIKPIFSTIENDFALPPMEEFERHITPRTKAILICNPNNPTGYLYSREELNQLRDIVKRYDLFLLSDEVYREFCYDGHKHISVMNLEGIEDNVVMIDSVSKRYSMCGVRLGTLASRNREVIEAALKMAQARLSPPYLAQVAAEAALDAPKSYFEEVYAEYNKRRICIVNALNEIEGVYCPMPKGAFYTTVRLPIDDSDRFAQWMLEEFSHKGETVMLAPATGFYASRHLGHDEVRVAYVLKCEDLLAAAECIREALKVYPGRTL
ncbi:pyridoxal phosphate-dependent aminotransferase [Gallalistipes aquisgranensis]|uniref:pyridoxal phosphate-dependent aminotransferase n=1 Tax=Gallalistipes aquisgranensis TaxID=2779358 RepID=UPI001CF809EC|nr:pyridoxal phosphate-dependent aminotransferase [Gallalistipes aquisgranensis]MBE5034172.1 pyridoxal phosphate-dependent aminotransferase [Gallalistipes aquisgranensis]